MGLVEPTWDEARAALAAAVRPLPAKVVALGEADGLVLAEDLLARTALPSFDTSAMDGWAVSGPGPWTVVGRSLAGRPATAPLRPGEAVEIATGAVVPIGAEAVIRSEDGAARIGAGGRARLEAPQPPGRTHVRPAGEECVADELLAPAGTRLNPAHLGLAAAAGHDELRAIPRPRAAVVLFGDELATSGVPAPGLVRDSLGPQLPAWLRRMDVTVVDVTLSGDTLAAHVAAISAATARADLLLTTGGTAAGPVDHLHAAIAGCGGELVVDRVAVRPGHPMLAATVAGGTWLVGLPGNPQSAVVALMSLAAPLLAGLSGRPPLPALRTVVAAADVPAPRHEERLVLGALAQGIFTPAPHIGSGMLRGLAAASGFAVLPRGGVSAGDAVRWLPLPL